MLDGVRVRVGVSVSVAVGVSVGVAVGVAVGVIVGVAVGATTASTASQAVEPKSRAPSTRMSAIVDVSAEVERVFMASSDRLLGLGWAGAA